MKLIPSQPDHLRLLRSWFPDRDAARRWGGPAVQFPFEDQAFLGDIRWHEIASRSLVGDRGELLGFGQFYEDHGYCRLARLVVAPEARGRGVGRRFVSDLMREGCQALRVDRCCLFVLEDNVPAIACYRSLGFTEAAYPDWQDNLPCVRFMVWPAGIQP